MELAVLVALAVIVSVFMLREIVSYVRWRRNLTQRDRGEWSATIRALRDR
jgi:hypothetical protein